MQFPLNLALLNEREVVGCFWGMWKARNPQVVVVVVVTRLGRQAVALPLTRAHPQANRENIEEVLELVRSGRLRPLVSQTYPVGKFHDAFEAMMTRKVLGKINIQVGHDVRDKAKL